MSATVAVVILNYNGLHFLKKFLTEVVLYSQPHRVIVADNASTDKSEAWVKSIEGAEWLPLDKNYGFAEGYNKALSQIDTSYYVLLNSDVKVGPNWLQPLLSRLQQSTNIAACQPKIKSYHQPKNFEYAGAAGGFLDWMGVPFCRGRIFDSLEQDTGQYDNARPVHWASGACLAIKAKDYWQVGGLDESFFAHMEEIDLCWRLRRLKKEIWCEPVSEVFHVGGGTLQATNPHKTYLNYRNGWWMLIKNYSAYELLKVLPVRLLVDILAAAQWILKGKKEFAYSIVKAHYQVWKKFKSVRKNYSRYPAGETTLYQHAIIWQYFGKKVKTFIRLPNKPDES